jgi:hypothetical protein
MKNILCGVAALILTASITLAQTPPALSDATKAAIARLKTITSSNYADSANTAYVADLVSNHGVPTGVAVEDIGPYADALYCNAIGKAEVFTKSASDRFAFIDKLNQSLDPQRDSDAVVHFIHSHWAIDLVAKADELRNKGQIDDALVIYNSLITQDPDKQGAFARAVAGIVSVKAIQKSPDALGWAKLCYLISDFSATQTGINAVTQALRSMDGNLSRVSSFISAQKDPSLPNVLANVKTPDVKLPPSLSNVASVIAGDNVGALKIVSQKYVVADGNAQLNAAIGAIAQTLRDVDGNLTRANSYVDAQKNGTTFVIAELQ